MYLKSSGDDCSQLDSGESIETGDSLEQLSISGDICVDSEMSVGDSEGEIGCMRVSQYCKFENHLWRRLALFILNDGSRALQLGACA